MNLALLAAQLKKDEGVKLVTYSDPVGLLTVGVGHLVLPQDQLVLGQAITAATCQQWLDADIEQAVVTCYRLWPDFDTLPEDVQQILANMAFQLGQTRLGKFVMLRQAIAQRDWAAAARAMRESLWYAQSGNRSKRLTTQMVAQGAPHA